MPNCRLLNAVRFGSWAAIALVLACATVDRVPGQTSRSERQEDLSGLAAQVNTLARAGRYGDALKVAQRAVELAESTLAPDHTAVGTALFNLASVYIYLGRLPEAEPLLQRVLAIKEKVHGPDHSDVGTTVNNLAVLYLHQGRYREAEPLLRRVVAIKERALGPVHTDVGTAVFGLATALGYLGRHGDAEPLFRRALAIKEAALGRTHSEVGTALFGLASLLVQQGRHREAEPLYRRTLEIKERELGPDHSEVATVLNNIAVLLQLERRYTEAEPLYARMLAIKERSLGPAHSDVGIALFNLGLLQKLQGHGGRAAETLARSLANLERSVGGQHPYAMNVLSELGDLAFSERRWRDAEAYYGRSTAIAIRRTEREGGTEQPQTQALRSEAAGARSQFAGLIRASLLREQADGAAAPSTGLVGASFVAAQWGMESDAARALAQMAARGAARDASLARLVRERQDLVAEWQRRDAERISSLSKPVERRDAGAEAANQARIAAIDGRIAEIDRRLASGFPEYFALSRPQPLSIEEVQRLLDPNEAMVLFFDTDEHGPVQEETLVWVVTAGARRLARAEIGAAGLRREVAALRCGLDASAWQGDGAQRCARLLGRNDGGIPASADELPFDLARAHALHRALFGSVADLIEGRRLIIVPSGALNALPFHVLVARMPQPTIAYADADWLGRRAAITVLPSAASLKSLRLQATASRADMPFIGFGNPLLDGRDGQDRRAHERQRCHPVTAQATSTARIAGIGAAGTASTLIRGGLADVEQLRRQEPLPETADELCAVARASGAADPDAVVHLGDRATESRVKALAADGTLARARVLHFATHGLVAGETARLAFERAEPALLLTPPARASAADDGLLMASEVSGLQLDADWVILSACNTAAGDRVGGDALSGLARAFFYAGARALLVSHWYVDSEATVELVTGTFEVLRDAPTVARSEALKRSMARLIDAGGRLAHPSTWASFVVVGEGGAAR